MHYIHMIRYGSEDFCSVVAHTIEEAQKLIEGGFEFVCDMSVMKLNLNPGSNPSDQIVNQQV